MIVIMLQQHLAFRVENASDAPGDPIAGGSVKSHTPSGAPVNQSVARERVTRTFTGSGEVFVAGSSHFVA